MALAVRERGWRDRPAETVEVDVVVPVLNEAHVLEGSIRTLYSFLSERLPYRWTIVIAENGSTDGTADIARRLCSDFDRTRTIVLPHPGRGDALRAAWSTSHADMVSYTDVDLSTDLSALTSLFDSLFRGGCDLAIGSRRLPGAKVTRSLRRRVLSHGYNELLRWLLRVSFTDAQTGFKAVTREVVENVLPLVKDRAWFFDTELLVLAERLGYRIADVPVTWLEDGDSRVKVIQTVWDDLRGISRLRSYLDSAAFERARSTRRQGVDARTLR